MSELVVPPDVVRMTLAANGGAGRAWLESLPSLVGELQDRWKLVIGAPFEGGCVGLVARAMREDGTRAVLKVSYIDDETRHEADALMLWDGNGAVRLLESDPGRGALLLERLEPGTSLFDHPDRDRAISIGCAILRRLWLPVPEVHPFTLVTDLARRWVTELPGSHERQGRPFEPSLVGEAASLCAGLAASTEETVLANRDFHLGNVLAAEREPWLAIDPKPLAGERAFDTGHLLRSLLPDGPPARSTVRGLVDRLADELELDRERVRAWALIRSVDDALWGREIGGDDVEWDVECARMLAGSNRS